MATETSELSRKVTEWGEDKGLHHDPGAQFEKLGEELGELSKAHATVRFWDGRTADGYESDYSDLKDEVKDAIGDMLVVLHQFCAGHDLRFQSCLFYPLPVQFANHDQEDGPWESLGRWYGRLGRRHAQYGPRNSPAVLRTPIGEVVEALRRIAEGHDLGLRECLEHAWEEIRDREGETKDGIFEKNGDSA